MVTTRSAHNAAVLNSELQKDRKIDEAMDVGASGDAACDHFDLYGVVEGFYGRPWSWGQRRKLFRMLRDLRLNCYMYAPKDDLKHRAYWKTMYTPEECNLLRRMIDDAASSKIVFVYALSPGVDITYSNDEDIEIMKRKLTQISQLGCTSFALLFDDLDPPQLRDVDAKKFKNFAEAQCAVANVIYDHLNKPQHFLFCPTEYCATRAVPNVSESEYLRTCGKMLPKPIHILWTGPNVISRYLPAESLIELENVIGRKCTIWDNLHANDYDRQRIYLGPYDRDPREVVQHVRGILLNPNCEFGANYLPIHSFHTWYHSQDVQQHNRALISKQQQQQQPQSSSSFHSQPLPLATPAPFSLDDAIEKAICWWTVEWNIPQDAYGNSLGSFQPPVLPMTSSPSPEPRDQDMPSVTSTDAASDSTNINATTQQRSSSRASNTTSDAATSASLSHFGAGTIVQTDDIRVLTELFYLPFQYGPIASELLEDFRWLRINAAMRRRMQHQQQQHQQSDSTGSEAPTTTIIPAEWEQRMQRFENHYARVKRMCNNLARCANRALLHELYPYFWDLNYLLSIIRSYLKWLMSSTQDGSDGGGGDNSSDSSNEWPSPGNRNEPWYNRGGLLGEFQRMLPLDVRSSDLFSCAASSDPHSEKVYSIRPYFESSDRVAVFELCAAGLLRTTGVAAQLLPQLDMPITEANTVGADFYNRVHNNNTSTIGANLMLPSSIRNFNDKRSPRTSGRSSQSSGAASLTVGEMLACNLIVGAYLNTMPSRLICFVNCIDVHQQPAPDELFSSTISSELICGYVMAATDARAFRANAKPWFQTVAHQYIRALQGAPMRFPGGGGGTGEVSHNNNFSAETGEMSANDIAVVQHLAQTFEILCCGPEHDMMMSPELYQQYPSILTYNVNEDDISAGNALKRLLTCALAALKSKRSPGVHAVVSKYNMHLKPLYQRFNFTELERRQVEIYKPTKMFADSRRAAVVTELSSMTQASMPDEAVVEVETLEIIIMGRSI